MKALIKRNKMIRSQYKILELNNYIKSAISNNGFSIKSNLNTGNLNTGVETAFKSKIRNICIVTGRTRAVFNNYKISRIQLKKLGESGQIPGLRKI